MSRVYADSVQPRWDYQDLTLGASGDTIDIAGNIITADVFKDSGGNTLFESNGSGVLSNINSGLKGDLVLIDSQTETNAASISFTSDIDSTYDLYIFKFIKINPATDAVSFGVQFNASGQTGYNETITSTFFRAIHAESGGAGSLGYVAGYDQAQGTASQALYNGAGNDADQNMSGELFLFNPSNTTYVKHFYSTLNGGQDADESANVFVGGYINVTAAIINVQFAMSSGNFDGTIKMYGLL